MPHGQSQLLLPETILKKNMATKVLITGATGLLGYDLWNVFSKIGEYEVYCLGRKPYDTNISFIPKERWICCDITRLEDLYNKITKFNPDFVIHTAAISNVDECESEPDLAYKVNTLGTRNVAIACARFDTICVYLSTDYVFDGENPPLYGYREYDIPNPINIYGKSKYLGECMVRSFLTKYYIIRTSWLFGQRRQTFVDTLIKEISTKREIKVANDQISIPTYTKDLAYAISSLIKRPSYGIYHITNSCLNRNRRGTTRYEMANFIRKVLNKEKEVNIIPITMDSLRLPAKRPKNTALDNYFWLLDGFDGLRPWEEALEEYISTKYNYKI
jgi:dTDP-4-dehydrorhamnose reductase